ncbi:hypothetical protein VCHA53O466_40057 [Vibrio chagasii]|nr:hypothetical protein VCHA53O466_40057 [Vibrio chagasii]
MKAHESTSTTGELSNHEATSTTLNEQAWNTLEGILEQSSHTPTDAMRELMARPRLTQGGEI